ncbi:hypothetical protein ACX40Y_07415 [Sphingomonas sp. RS6]
MPAAAQIWGGATPASIGTSRQGPSLGRDLAGVDREIDAGRANGRLTRAEARALRRERDQIDMLADRYGANGISDAEAAELETRARLLREDAIRAKSIESKPPK